MKGLTDILADNAAVPCNPNRAPRPLIDELLQALRVARASLKDVLTHGAKERQLQNINHTDLPLIQKALDRAAKEAN